MDQQVKDLINNEIKNNEVCLFMKGTPDAPQCGFSMAVSNMLKLLEVNYKGVNVLENQSMRDGIKEFSDWPTIPQLYIKNEFIGNMTHDIRTPLSAIQSLSEDILLHSDNKLMQNNAHYLMKSGQQLLNYFERIFDR